MKRLRWMLITGLLVGSVIVATVRAQSPGGTQSPNGPPDGVGPAQVMAPVFSDTSRPLREMVPHGPPTRPGVEIPLHKRPRLRHTDNPTVAVDTVVQDLLSAPNIPSTSQNFEGIGNVNEVLPPDTNGDVSANYYVQTVNLSLAVFNRDPVAGPTMIYGPVPVNTLWQGSGFPECESRNDGDPIVLYDHLADRWLVSQLAIPYNLFGLLFAPFYQCIAVSATPDPTGPYHRYAYSFSKLNDYPKFGVWPDGYYMTINQYTELSLQWAGQGVAVFDRAKMLQGQAANGVLWDMVNVDPNLGGMLPADLDGPAPPEGSPNFFVEIDDDAWGYSPDQLQIWELRANWAAPLSSTFTRAAALPTAPFDSNMCAYARNCIPQAGTTVRLDALSDRLMYRLQYRNFGTHQSLVVNHTVDADAQDHAGIRWYEIRNPGPSATIHQQGTYAPDADHRWSGSAAMDSAGNLAIGFSVSGAVTWPSIRYAGRLVTDPLGALSQGEADIAVGTGAQTDGSGRWGDYSMMAVDPVDGCTFWYTQEYYTDTTSHSWRTRVGTFAFPSCASGGGDPPPPPPVETPTVHVGGLAGATASTGKNKWTAVVTVTVNNGDGLVVSDAAVTGTWSGQYSGTGTCTTLTDGTCSMASPSLPRRRQGGSVTFTVTNVSKSGFDYSAGDNVATSVTMNQP